MLTEEGWMEVPFNDLWRAHQLIGKEIFGAVARVINNSAFVLGKEVEGFEREFAAYLGVKHAIGVGSGTDALILSLKSMRIGLGDEVITAALSAFPTAEAILATGAKPVYVDINPSTYTLDPEKIEEAITGLTRAIIPVHLYGLPADMDRITDTAKRHSLFVLEDCAQAHGANILGKYVGTWGLAGAFSFYPTKNLGAMGDGGMVVTDDDEIAERVRSLRNHGRTDRYTHHLIGMNSRLDGIQAAVLRVKLKYLNKWNAERRRIAAYYHELLEKKPWLTLPSEPEGHKHVYHLYAVSTDPYLRDDLRRHLNQYDIRTEIHYPIPQHLQPANPYGAESMRVQTTERIARSIVSLPLFPGMNMGEIFYVADKILNWRA